MLTDFIWWKIDGLDGSEFFTHFKAITPTQKNILEPTNIYARSVLSFILKFKC